MLDSRESSHVRFYNSRIVVLSSSLYDRMKTMLDIEMKNTSAVAVATIDMIATTVDQLLQLEVFSKPTERSRS